MAAEYLICNGYSIQIRNFRTRCGEIDIIAKDGEYLVFIEVKTRTSVRFGAPREAVDYHKQNRIKNIAKLYLLQKKFFDKPVRFDVVEVLLTDKSDAKSIIIIKNAFD